MISSHCLLLADAGVRRFLGLEPLFPVHEPWQWLLVALLGICGLVLIAVMYFFDGIELPPGITVLLATLRVFAVIGLFVFFINPVIRSEREIVKKSIVKAAPFPPLTKAMQEDPLFKGFGWSFLFYR